MLKTTPNVSGGMLASQEVRNVVRITVQQRHCGEKWKFAGWKYRL